jgi:hypothetical protein
MMGAACTAHVKGEKKSSYTRHEGMFSGTADWWKYSAFRYSRLVEM